MIALHTLSEENYLKELYKLSIDSDTRVATSHLAHILEVNAASVTEKLQKMAQKDLVDYKKSKGVLLTKIGREAAIAIIRKHRIWETFLVSTLGFGWEEVHEIAEQLEHIKSDKLIDRIEKSLGFPRFDPHGDPIPDIDGRINKTCFRSLNQLEPNMKCRIVGVKEDNPVFLNHFVRLGFKIGDKVSLDHIEPFDKSMWLIVNKKSKISITQEVANNILVTFNNKCCVFDKKATKCPT